ncbi:hypothetical protein K438DRAFT_1984770 [Mycena galopus ATCC 62051]|nr:hypothetical protein K438DRAFT_1984770 [Mycena galopus ATCC 62051]
MSGVLPVAWAVWKSISFVLIPSTAVMVHVHNMKGDDNKTSRWVWPWFFMLGYAFFTPVIFAIEFRESPRAQRLWDYFRRLFGPCVPGIFSPEDWCYEPRVGIVFGFMASPLNMVVTTLMLRAYTTHTLAQTLAFTLAFVGWTLGSIAVVYIISGTARMTYRRFVQP